MWPHAVELNMYDEVIRLNMWEVTKVIGFADGRVLVVGGKTETGENSLRLISSRIEDKRLKLTPAKKEAISRPCMEQDLRYST